MESAELNQPLSGVRVAVLESRRADLMAELIRKHGGEPVVAPALRELPIEHNPSAARFAEDLSQGRIDAVIFLTGVGARYLADELQAALPRDAFIQALRGVKVVVRGPKPLAVMREWEVPVAVAVPEPNTWREILAALDESLPVKDLRVAVQEYGKPSPELVAGLEARGAVVSTVPVYRWGLPEDPLPLLRCVADFARSDGTISAVAFTAAQQVHHLIEVAEAAGQLVPMLARMREHITIASIGPTTSEALEQHGLLPDVEPGHSKMGHLISSLANRFAVTRAQTGASCRIEGAAEIAPVPAAAADPARESPFLKACRREPTPFTPIWLMRQAGRYMPEYRELRSKVSFLELCKTPELACEVTVHAAERLGVDAAILFADILLILEPLGFELEFTKGDGPCIHNPIRTSADVDRVPTLASVPSLEFVCEAVRLIRRALKPNLPLIGFAGGPFTVACYAIEGGGSRHYEKAKAFMFRDLGAWNALMERITAATSAYLNAQIAAGAQAIQVFDSWVGVLAPADYARFVQPHMKRLFASLPPSTPSIHFGTDTGSLLELQRDAGGTVIGLDWRVDLTSAWDRLGERCAVQGNLDPVALLGPVEEMRRMAQRVLQSAAGRAGYIFNLGHGILPQTPVDSVLALVDEVHAFARQ